MFYIQTWKVDVTMRTIGFCQKNTTWKGPPLVYEVEAGLGLR